MKYMNFTNKNGQPIRNNTNNAILNTLGAMPMKDGISDSTSNFSINRHKYFNTFNTNNQTHFQYLHNKFIGGNTDSSSIISKNKSYAVSVSSFPEDKKPTSLVNTKNINIIDSALRRARGSVSK